MFILKRRIQLLVLVSVTWLGTAEAADPWKQVAELAAPEAIQAAAADEQSVYAIASAKVARYDRSSGRRTGISTGPAKHLNSGFLWRGKLLCAHSNYPQKPEQSEIKLLDPESMRLSTFKDFGNFGGSLTWVVRHGDHWWCNFAKYDDKNAETFFVRFDDKWRETGRWTYPDSVVRQLGRFSLSGGLWWGQELLVTGHDKTEFYRLRLPRTGRVLEYTGKQSVPFTGQGFAKDPLTGGLVGINRAQRKVVFVNADGPSAPLTHGPFVGHITSREALVWARFSKPGRCLVRALSPGGHEVFVQVHSTSDRDGCVQWHLKSLRPGTRYHYEIEFDGKLLVSGDNYFFETAGSKSSGTIRVAFGSCAKEDAGSSAVWHRMRTVDPHAVVLLGDTPYIDSVDLAVQRKRHAEFASVPEYRKLFRNRSLYATWDDHDFGRNDTDGNLKGKENSRRAFIEYRSNPSYGDGHRGIYSKFRRGGVEVFLLDTRFFAGTEPSPFDKDRPSLLGKRQWKWLRRQLKASTAPFKVLACGMVWNDAVRPGKLDHWGTYPHERQALFEFIGDEKISGIILVGGDVHRTRVLQHDSVESAGYKIPEFITSPVHGGVIENAKVDHPGLVRDFGQPNTFLLMTVQGATRPNKLKAGFLDKAGRVIFEFALAEQDLTPK